MFSIIVITIMYVNTTISGTGTSTCIIIIINLSLYIVKCKKDPKNTGQERCSTYMQNSMNVPSSRSTGMGPAAPLSLRGRRFGATL